MHADGSSTQEPPKRTGRVAPKNAKDEQQRRQYAVAARRAATALQGRGRPRMMVWSDGKKAAIRRYPDGREEILVPQNLTTEQIQYEFPPRSRLLKRLATSKAEQRRLSMLKHPVVASPHPIQDLAPPAVQTTLTPQPDRVALDEWFSRKNSRVTKDKTIFNWMTDMEQPIDTPPSRPVRSPATPVPSVTNITPSSGRTDASTTPALVVPEDGAPRHYVPLRLLQPRRTAETLSLASSPQSLPAQTRRQWTPEESDQRVSQLEQLWRRERERRVQAEQQSEQMVYRISLLQRDLESEKTSRQELQTTLDALSQKMNAFHSSASKDSRDRTASRQNLQKQLDRALDELTSLKRAHTTHRIP